MTQTPAHPCHAQLSSSSISSSSDLQHAQQRRRRQSGKALLLLPLLLLLHCSDSASAAQRSSRFIYAAQQQRPAQGRVLRDTNAQTDTLLADATAATADAKSCCQSGASTTSGGSLPLVMALELSNVTEISETDVTVDSGRGHVKRSLTRTSDIPRAVPAICSPQPTIVELKPTVQSEGSNAVYVPTCIRVNLCSGCCGSTLVSCQPTQTKTNQLRVQKLTQTDKGHQSSTVVVSVEEHLACRCDCRTKASDCNAYQEYRKDVCRCECHNTDARDKCLEQQELKYWDDANCTCACRYNQNCTTGTIFDETLCKCTDPGAHQFVDRKRFIVQAVAVEPDNSTLYSL